MSTLSTVYQFKNNCESLNQDMSNITDVDIENIIRECDEQIKIDLANVFDPSDILGSIPIFNLLSQYKSAARGLEIFYGAERAEESQEVKYWYDKYKYLLDKIYGGIAIYDGNGDKIESNRVAPSYARQPDTFFAGLDGFDDD